MKVKMGFGVMGFVENVTYSKPTTSGREGESKHRVVCLEWVFLIDRHYVSSFRSLQLESL